LEADLVIAAEHALKNKISSLNTATNEFIFSLFAGSEHMLARSKTPSNSSLSGKTNYPRLKLTAEKLQGMI